MHFCPSLGGSNPNFTKIAHLWDQVAGCLSSCPFPIWVWRQKNNLWNAVGLQQWMKQSQLLSTGGKSLYWLTEPALVHLTRYALISLCNQVSKQAGSISQQLAVCDLTAVTTKEPWYVETSKPFHAWSWNQCGCIIQNSLLDDPILNFHHHHPPPKYYAWHSLTQQNKKVEPAKFIFLLMLVTGREYR